MNDINAICFNVELNVQGDSHVILAASSQKELFESLKSIYPYVDKKNLTEIVDSKFCEELKTFEDTMVMPHQQA